MAASEAVITDAQLINKVQPFLDEWFYRILASPVGKQWSRKKTLFLLMDVLGMIGINVPVDDRAALVEAEDDGPLTQAIIVALPGELREKFEATALQLQTVLHEATRILGASEEEDDEPIATLFDEAGSERGGLPQQVLKSSVVFAAKEVSKLRKIHTSWRLSTDGRIKRLLVCTEEAEHCQQQLMAAEAQLAEYHGDAKAKGKGLLMNMAEGQDKALAHAVFSSWLGWMEKVHAEKEIRDRFQAQIDNCTAKLLQYKEAQIANIRGVLMRGAMQDTEVLMHFIWKTWTDEVAERKAEGDTAELLKAAQDKMNALGNNQKENAGKFMTRMASGNEASLKNLCLESWIKFHSEYAADKEMEDKVKDAEGKFKAHMDAKKEEAKVVMERMLAGTEHGLLCMIIQNWALWLKDEKQQKELEFALAEGQAKFKSLNNRQKDGSRNVQGRVNDQMNANIQQRIFNNWIVETKANRVENHYNSKYESKRRQLQGVQNLFKSFAMQLEQNLGGDDDSSSRTYRRSNKHGKGMSKTEGTVSLPDIHQKVAA